MKSMIVLNLIIKQQKLMIRLKLITKRRIIETDNNNKKEENEYIM